METLFHFHMHFQDCFLHDLNWNLIVVSVYPFGERSKKNDLLHLVLEAAQIADLKSKIVFLKYFDETFKTL